MKSIVFCFFVLFVYTSCDNLNIKKKFESIYPVTEVTTFDTTAFTDYTAEIHAVQNVELRARVTGYLEKVHIDEGEFVKEGQLLFSINSLEYKEDLTKAKAIYKSALADANAANLELKSVRQLVEKNVISNTELELALNKVEAANARVDEAKAMEATAQLKLSYAEIKAPFSGILNRIPHKIGSLIEEGTLLTSISENDEVFAYFDVSEKEYLNYASNFKTDSIHSKRVSLILANGNEHTAKGEIETIESEIDKSTGNIAFRARFKNPGKLLKHGASGKVRLTKKYNNVLIIPQKSTFEIQDKMYVYLVDKDNIVTPRNIISLNRIPHLYIVSAGLKKGDRIIYEGIQDLQEGFKITSNYIPLRDIIKELAIN
jgi:membrane fusion protein (multidrug efflux system)